MAKKQNNDEFVDLQFPLSGIDLTSEFEEQRQGTTQGGVNVRAYEPITNRARGGQRAGLGRYIPHTVGVLDEDGADAPANVIQHLAIIVDPTVEGLLSDEPAEGADVVNDPSTSNRARRRIPAGQTRTVRNGGSGSQTNLKQPRPTLTITADNQTKDEGDTFTFGGTEYSATGLGILDTLGAATIRSNGAKASATPADYPITIKDVQGSVAGDGSGTAGLKKKYKIKYESGVMTVSDGPLVEFVLYVRVRFPGVGQTYEANGSIDGDIVGSVTASGDDAALFRYHTWSTGATRPSGFTLAGIDDGNTGNFPVLAGMRSLTSVLNASNDAGGNFAVFGITKCEDGSPVAGNTLNMTDPVTGSNPYGPLLFNVDYAP